MTYYLMSVFISLLPLQKFESDLIHQEAKLAECLRLGADILKRAHPDAVSTMKHWLTILQARWEEVTTFTSLVLFLVTLWGIYL